MVRDPKKNNEVISVPVRGMPINSTDMPKVKFVSLPKTIEDLEAEKTKTVKEMIIEYLAGGESSRGSRLKSVTQITKNTGITKYIVLQNLDTMERQGIVKKYEHNPPQPTKWALVHPTNEEDRGNEK